MAKMRQEIAERDRKIVERDQELERLKAQIDKLRRMHFGRKRVAGAVLCRASVYAMGN